MAYKQMPRWFSVYQNGSKQILAEFINEGDARRYAQEQANKWNDCFKVFGQTGCLGAFNPQ
jgi:hypothetical protein